MKPFDTRRTNYAACQRCVMKLLKASPLPWTNAMLKDWYGVDMSALGALEALILHRRVWRCAYGLYTSIDRKPKIGPKIIVTDDMLSRYGFNL